MKTEFNCISPQTVARDYRDMEICQIHYSFQFYGITFLAARLSLVQRNGRGQT